MNISKLNQSKQRTIALVLIFTIPTMTMAIEDRADTTPNDPLDPGEIIAFKATLGTYSDSLRGDGNDINLRGNTENFAFWVGKYKDQDYNQTRLGVEYSIALPYGKLVPSFQTASGGFIGGSLTWDGKQEGVSGWAPIVGIGRTNLRPYFNLNFDPNDSLMAGGSYTSSKLGLFMFYQIWDDKLGTGQRVTHAVWRHKFPDGIRVTADVFKRVGAETSTSPQYQGTGLTLTFDIRDYFFRMGYDPFANYKQGNITRLAIGYRF